MSIRAQLTILTALAVAAAVVIVSLVAYFATRQRLRNEVDEALRARAQTIADARGLPRHEPGVFARGPLARDPFATADTLFQVINESGAVVAEPATQEAHIPVSDEDIAVAKGQHEAFLRDVSSGGLHLRVITSPGRSGEAVQIARSLAEVDASLRGLRNVLFGVSGAGIALAALLGLVIAERSLRPVIRLTAAAEHVAATQELDAAIDIDRNDEIGRLARSFNAMLEALQQSRRQQQQLVTDASHELRTPLTSLRTNIEVLIRSDDLPPAERRQLLRDVTFELEELTRLVSELVELAAEKRQDAQTFEDVRLDQLAAAAVERAARRSGLQIELDARPTLVVGNYTLLERAAGNLLDNACKWSPPGATVEVRVADGTFTVRDHGPGIAEEDLPHVFHRFYRADAARSKPGSGLGLAIVKQIIDAHSGEVWVEPAPGGGTIAGFRLEAIPVEIDQPIAGTA